MLKNIFRLVFRNMLRNKLYSTINIVGLTVGLASFFYIALFVYNELTYDQFWKNSESIFRVDAAWTSPNGESRYATAPPPLASRLQSDIVEIEYATRIFKRSDFTLRPETDVSKVFRETNVYMADENYFNVFSNRLIQGDEASCLSNPESIVISESAARRYFGDAMYERGSLIGKNILGGKDGGTLWKITGVMKDIPINSHQNFEMVVPMNNYFRHNKNWGWNLMHTYVRTSFAPDETIISNIKNGLSSILNNYAIPSMGSTADEGESIEYYLMPIDKIHLHSDYLREMTTNSSIETVYIFSVVALLILIVACVNFTNLTIAHSSRRAVEIGVRKTLGSTRENLTFQLICESFIYGLIATIMAVTITELLVLFLNPFLELEFRTSVFDNPYLLSPLVFIPIATSLLSGIYPAVIISKYQPAKVLKGNKSMNVGGEGLRDGLIIFQFAISIGLVVATTIMTDQMNFIRNSRLGFEKENTLIIQNDREIDDQKDEFRSRLLTHPEILDVSFSTGIPASDRFMVRSFSVNEVADGMRWFEIDENFVNTLSINIKEGRNFRYGSSYDSLGVILNQEAVKALGLSDPVGKQIVINEGDDDERTVNIIGIAENFHFESLHKAVKPLIMEFLRSSTFKDYISIKLVPGDVINTVQLVEQEWHSFEPDVPFNYSFLDVNFENQYKSEVRISKIFNIFSVLALFIASLGLFGFAAYSLQQRTKEMGIRKVLGAKVVNIVILLLSRLALLALIGLVLGSLISFIGMQEWLSSFVVRTELSIHHVLNGFIATVGILLISVFYQTIKIGVSNPVNTLKEE